MYSIKQNNIAVRFDDSGSLVSIIDHSDQFESNFLGNPDNVTNFPDKPVWTGNIFSKVWQTEGSDTDTRNHMGAHIEGATINDGEEPSEEQPITEKAITNKINNFIKDII